MAMRALLIDDEPLALRRLEIAIQSVGDCEIVGKAQDGETARDLIAETRPDLLLVDIKMPGLTGLQLVEAIEMPVPPAVIFVTAFEQFAVKAFESGAVDYILKPVDETRLAQAIERARVARLTLDADQRLSELRGVVKALQEARQAQEADPYEDELWISHRGMSVRIGVKDVQMFEAAGDYVKVHTAEQDYLHFVSLRSLEERLDPNRFMRIHRGAIVALPYISGVARSAYGGLNVNLESGAIAKCSRSCRAQLQARLGVSGRQ